MSKAAKRGEGKRRVVASISEELYIRLIATKLQTRRSLEKLMEEGITLIITKYRIERETAAAPARRGEE